MFDNRQEESREQQQHHAPSESLQSTSFSPELQAHAAIMQAREIEARFPTYGPAPLNPEHHAEIRAKLFERMPDNSMLIIGGETDTGALFRQNPDLFYASGFEAPDAFCVLRKVDGNTEAILLLHERDAQRALWDGPLPDAEDVVSVYGLDRGIALQDSTLQEVLVPLLDGVEIMYTASPKSKYSDSKHPVEEKLQQAIAQSPFSGTHEDGSNLIHQSRLVKSPYEIALLMRAAKVTAQGHRNAMQSRGQTPGERRQGRSPNEGQIQADLERSFRRYGAVRPSFTTIVGADENACILHYIDNNQDCAADSLVLVDGGAEYSGYAGDITRTWPVSGRFTEAQAEIYQIVLDAQKLAIEAVAPGLTQGDLHKIAFDEMKRQLLEKGILPEDQADNMKKIFPHGTGHVIGLDVHDVFGDRDSKKIPLEPGMLITIEPGIYLPKSLTDALGIDERYANIGVRIEDDVLVGPDGPHVLTAIVPKEISEIERLMAG